MLKVGDKVSYTDEYTISNYWVRGIDGEDVWITRGSGDDKIVHPDMLEPPLLTDDQIQEIEERNPDSQDIKDLLMEILLLKQFIQSPEDNGFWRRETQWMTKRIMQLNEPEEDDDEVEDDADEDDYKDNVINFRIKKLLHDIRKNNKLTRS
jgi:hypothetical protein